MFAKFKGAIVDAISNLETESSEFRATMGLHSSNSNSQSSTNDRLQGNLKKLPIGVPGSVKFAYQRPSFLQLESEDEIQVTADHIIRPIIVPRDIRQLPWNAGYAECINAGKSVKNEDQASVHRGTLHSNISAEIINNKVTEMLPISILRPPVSPTVTTNGTDTSPAINGSSLKSISLSTSTSTLSSSAVGANESQANGSTSDSNDISQPLKQVMDLQSPSEPLPIASLMTSPSSNDISSSTCITSSTPIALKLAGIVQGLHEESLPWTYFGLFDGHAGSSVAVAASILLHRLIQEKLESIADLLIAFGLNGNDSAQDDTCSPSNDSDQVSLPKYSERKSKVTCYHCNCSKNDTIIYKNANYTNESCIINHIDQRLDLSSSLTSTNSNFAADKQVTVDSLIIGALESAFWELDNQIAIDKRIYRMSGGCTALVALFILGKVYIANAGDSRAIIIKSNSIIPMSYDFTPESERERVKYLGLLRPELLGSDFTQIEFIRRPMRKDLGKKLLYRDAYMSGWSYKTVTPSDLKFPLVYGEGKRSRVLGTIGVTRGFGDHELKAQASSVDIKPFLTPQPQVQVYDLSRENLSPSDLLIMGTDGLWDVTSNETAANVVQSALNHFPVDDGTRYKYRYISAAQDLVMSSRGKPKSNSRVWRTVDNKQATIDDVSVFVIPLLPYQEEWNKWKQARTIVMSAATAAAAASTTTSETTTAAAATVATQDQIVDPLQPSS